MTQNQIKDFRKIIEWAQKNIGNVDIHGSVYEHIERNVLLGYTDLTKCINDILKDTPIISGISYNQVYTEPEVDKKLYDDIKKFMKISRELVWDIYPDKIPDTSPDDVPKDILDDEAVDNDMPQKEEKKPLEICSYLNIVFTCLQRAGKDIPDISGLNLDNIRDVFENQINSEEIRHFRDERKTILDALEKCKKELNGDCPKLSDEDKNKFNKEIDRLNKVLSECSSKKDLNSGKILGIYDCIQNAVNKVDIVEKVYRGLNTYYKKTNIFSALTNLHKAINDICPCEVAEKTTNLIYQKLSDDLNSTKEYINTHAFDPENSALTRRMLVVSEYYTSLPEPKRFEAKRLEYLSTAYVEMPHQERMSIPSRSYYGDKQLGKIILNKADIGALSGSGSTEYTRLADAMKKYRNAPEASVKELYEAARDYLKCKKTEPISPEGKRRVKAAVKVMAQTAVQIMEDNYYGSNELAKEKAYTEMETDLKVECTRNSLFRSIMVNECPHLIEYGIGNMFRVMNYAVACQNACNEKTAFVEGPIAEASVNGGKFSLKFNAHAKIIDNIIDSSDDILEKYAEKNNLASNPQSEDVRNLVDKLTKDYRTLCDPSETEPRPDIPTLGVVGAVK